MIVLKLFSKVVVSFIKLVDVLLQDTVLLSLMIANLVLCVSESDIVKSNITEIANTFLPWIKLCYLASLSGAVFADSPATSFTNKF
jgi:hypothetical protein